MRSLVFNSLVIVLLSACSNKAQSPVEEEVTVTTTVTADNSSSPDSVTTTTTITTTTDEAGKVVTENTNVNANSVQQKGAKTGGSQVPTPDKTTEIRVIEHGSPNQSEIDSLKAAKTKGKK